MAHKIYAQDDLQLDAKTTIKKGKVFVELPDGVTLDHVVHFATTGKLGGKVKAHDADAATDAAGEGAKEAGKEPAKQKAGVIGGATPAENKA